MRTKKKKTSRRGRRTREDHIKVGSNWQICHKKKNIDEVCPPCYTSEINIIIYNKVAKPYKRFQSQHHGTSQKVKISLGKGRLLAGRAAFSHTLSLCLVSQIIKHLFMIKICVTLNEGQGQYNSHVMHYHV